MPRQIVPFRSTAPRRCLLSVIACLDARAAESYPEIGFFKHMAVALQDQSLATRPCVFCGKQVLTTLSRCPYCREEIPQVRLAARSPRSGGGQQIRRGLLYMLLAGVIQYFASGASGFAVPVQIPPAVTTYLAPAVFVSGLGLLIYGFILRSKS